MRRFGLIVAIAVLVGCGGHRDGPRYIATPPEIRDPLPDPRPHSTPAESTEAAAASHLPDTVKSTSAAPRDIAMVILELNNQLRDAFFDYDRSDLGDGAISALRQDAALLLPILAEFPNLKVMVEGHCDERGSAEYNLGLGARRAERAMEVLRGLGMPMGNMETISYGKEAPQCMEAADSCWRRNRRAHLVVRQAT